MQLADCSIYIGGIHWDLECSIFRRT